MGTYVPHNNIREDTETISSSSDDEGGASVPSVNKEEDSVTLEKIKQDLSKLSPDQSKVDTLVEEIRRLKDEVAGKRQQRIVNEQGNRNFRPMAGSHMGTGGFSIGQNNMGQNYGG